MLIKPKLKENILKDIPFNTLLGIERGKRTGQDKTGDRREA